MRLVLPIPPAWQHRAVDDGVLYQAPSEVYGMLVTPLAAALEDPETWVQRAFFHRARPEDGEPRNLQLSRFASVAGWGIVLLDGALGTQARFVAYLAWCARQPATYEDTLAAWRAGRYTIADGLAAEGTPAATMPAKEGA